MATVTTSSTTGFSFDALNLADFNGSEIVTATATGLTLQAANGETLMLEGSGFTYDLNEQLTGGTVTRITYSGPSGAGGMDIQDIHTDASQMAQWVYTGDTQAALTAVLAGPTTISAEGGGDDLLRAYGGGGTSMNGFGGHDTMIGGAGDDNFYDSGYAGQLFTGGGGNDSITGGDGWNTASYSGAKSDYSIAINTDGSVTVTDLRAGAPDGVDHLVNVQTLAFSDGSDVLGPTTATAAFALGMALVLRDPGVQTSSDAGMHGDLLSDMLAGVYTPAQIITQIVQHAEATASVATLAYQFFTGAAPKAAGMDYLVSPTGPNPNNLNSAYYQAFGLENRYINFASNLGKAGGAGAVQFQTDYGALSMSDALTKAYTAIFGSAPSADKVGHLLNDLVPDGAGGTYARVDYFASYGGDGTNGVGTKAAMVGWLLAEAVKADVGTYAKANDAYLTDVVQHNAAMGVDIIGHYAQQSFAFTPAG